MAKIKIPATTGTVWHNSRKVFGEVVEVINQDSLHTWRIGVRWDSLSGTHMSSDNQVKHFYVEFYDQQRMGKFDVKFYNKILTEKEKLAILIKHG